MLFIMLDVSVVRTHWDVVWKFPLTDQINVRLTFLSLNIIFLGLSPSWLSLCTAVFLKIDSPQILCKLWSMTKTINIFKIFLKGGGDGGDGWWRQEVWWFILIWGHWSHGGQCHLITCRDCVGEKGRSRPTPPDTFCLLWLGLHSTHLYFGCWPLITSGAGEPIIN